MGPSKVTFRSLVNAPSRSLYKVDEMKLPKVPSNTDIRDSTTPFDLSKNDLNWNMLDYIKYIKHIFLKKMFIQSELIYPFNSSTRVEGSE